jgi:hypothetical protein
VGATELDATLDLSGKTVTLAAGEVSASEMATTLDLSGKTVTLAAGEVSASEMATTLDLSSKTVTLPAASVTAHVTQTDTTGLENDIAILGFKVAANGSLAKYDLVDQTIDDFQDSSGIDAGSSTNENISGGYVNGATGNYYGDASDGSLSTAGNVTHTVQNKSGSYDGDMVIKQYSSLTINTGHTMTVDQACRGMFIYVSGDCTINGTLSMTDKGGYSNPTTSGGSDSNAVGASGLQLGLITTGGSTSFTNDGSAFAGAGTAVKTAIANQINLSSNGTVFSISKAGGGGGTAGTSSYGPSSVMNGTAGSAGATGASTISTGGGGSGAGYAYTAAGGNGGSAGAFSAGTGGGGHVDSTAGSQNAGHMHGAGYGGAGGRSRDWSGMSGYSGEGGGAGNPGGGGSRGGSSGATGAGGIIWLVVGGNLTIGSGGSIQANGANGGSVGSQGAGGGGSGGGAVFVLYKETLSNSGSITATGGSGGSAAATGGNGGAGGTHIAQLGAIIGGLTLVSNSTTAEATPTKGDLVLTYTSGAGTTSIGDGTNGDIRAFVSRDNGTNYTQVTLVDEGDTGAHTILTAHDVDISSQPSGTAMRYKITTHNQSSTLDTRIQAVSLGWS